MSRSKLRWFSFAFPFSLFLFLSLCLLWLCACVFVRLCCFTLSLCLFIRVPFHGISLFRRFALISYCRLCTLWNPNNNDRMRSQKLTLLPTIYWDVVTHWTLFLSLIQRALFLSIAFSMLPHSCNSTVPSIKKDRRLFSILTREKEKKWTDKSHTNVWKVFD